MLADDRPSALRASILLCHILTSLLITSAIVLADARPLALLALGPLPVVLEDVGPLHTP